MVKKRSSFGIVLGKGFDVLMGKNGLGFINPYKNMGMD